MAEPARPWDSPSHAPLLSTTHATHDAGGAVTLRSARASDAPALHVLAALDSARPLRGEALVAGRVVAAMQLPARKRRRPSFGGFGALRPRLA